LRHSIRLGFCESHPTLPGWLLPARLRVGAIRFPEGAVFLARFASFFEPGFPSTWKRLRRYPRNLRLLSPVYFDFLRQAGVRVREVCLLPVSAIRTGFWLRFH